MEESEPVVVCVKSGSKLRYPLRSGSKAKEEKPLVVESSSTSASRRVRPASTVSQSMGVLDLSAKEKSAAKPPRRRLSIPTKSTVSPVPKLVGNITPISEMRAKRSANTPGKSETPLSDVSRASSTRKKFNILSSASYWLSQIKLSESAGKHSISLGFFKLALEAGCEPLQRMRDELKSYARRHNLGELGDPVKDLFDSYNISETPEQLQVSETGLKMADEGTRSSDDEVHSSSSTMGIGKLKPKSLNTDAAQDSLVTESAKKETTPKNNPEARTRASVNANSVNSGSETSEQLQVSEICSQVPEEGSRSSDDDVHSYSSTMGVGKLQPKSLNANAAQVSPVKESVKKETTPKNNHAARARASVKKNSVARSVSDTKNRKTQQPKPQKPTKQETNKENDKIKKLGKKSPPQKVPVSTSPPAEEQVEGNKENMDASAEELYPTEVVV